MRYALISDIHGNLEALEAVINVLGTERIGAYLCIGDVVGYGANPKECIEIVRSLKPEVLIAGNHERGALGFLDIEYFNENAQEAVAWTKKILKSADLDYLKSFDLVRSIKNMTLVHGSLEAPEKFYYIFNKDDASGTLRLSRTQLCFVGHSHVAGIFRFDGNAPVEVNSFKTAIEPDMKYVINIGSVGQPRDGDPRASFAIYDEEAAIMEIRRVRYNIEAASAKIMAAGLPPRFASRLAVGH